MSGKIQDDQKTLVNHDDGDASLESDDEEESKKTEGKPAVDRIFFIKAPSKSIQQSEENQLWSETLEKDFDQVKGALANEYSNIAKNGLKKVRLGSWRCS